MITALDRTRALQAAALCLGYPDEAMLAYRPLLRATEDSLPARLAAPLARFLDHLDRTEPAELARAYVETFDLRRRCCLYLTYYAHGDTRKRGMALLRFSQAYRRAGYAVTDGELGDHLGVVCEFAARVPDAGVSLLRESRAAVELLAMALADARSPWHDVIELIQIALPGPAPSDLQHALALARSGPPAEEVGLEPFMPPEHPGARR